MPQTNLPNLANLPANPVVRFVWEVIPSSPRETYLPGQARVTARVRTAYDQRIPFLNLVTGYSYDAIQGGKRVIRRITPLEYPYHRGLYCIGSANVDGLSPGLPGMPVGTISKNAFQRYAPGAANVETYTQPNLNQPDYLDASIELVFSTLEYRIRSDADPLMKSRDTNNPGWLGLIDEGDALQRGVKRYITRTAVDTGKVITVPGNFLFYKQFGIPIPQSSNSIYQFSQDLTYEWHDIPENCLPYTAWNRCAKGVNRYKFDGYPAETLLFKGYAFKRETDSFGLEKYRVRYTFRFLPNWDEAALKAQGHNYVLAIGPKYFNDGTANPNAGKLVFLEVCTRGSTLTTSVPGVGSLPTRPIAPLNGSPVYPLVDFRDLFRPEQPPGPF